MITGIFSLLMIIFVGKLIWTAVKLSLGIVKALFFIFVFPIILIVIFVLGFAYIAIGAAIVLFLLSFLIR